jgi:hypothetical protein
MAQDIRKLARENMDTVGRLKSGHTERFLEKLEKQLPKHKSSHTNRFLWMKMSIAASLVAALTLSYLLLKPDNPANLPTVTERDDEVKNQITLGDLSPDLKKIELYYTLSIQSELAGLQVTGSNKQLIDNYLKKLADLDDEYKGLSNDLNTIGPNSQTVAALIQNLQIRLNLLYQLDEKLKQLKKSNTHESI